jgi:hypothetical protein
VTFLCLGRIGVVVCGVGPHHRQAGDGGRQRRQPRTRRRQPPSRPRPLLLLRPVQLLQPHGAPRPPHLRSHDVQCLLQGLRQRKGQLFHFVFSMLLCFFMFAFHVELYGICCCFTSRVLVLVVTCTCCVCRPPVPLRHGTLGRALHVELY